MNEAVLCEWRDEYLDELEALLGPRSSEYRLGTVRKQKDHRPPTIWMPRNGNIVDILLTPHALIGTCSWRLAKWQLAHECVHLIDPNFAPPTIAMEEGIASWFQNKKVEPLRSCVDPPYKRAEFLVTPYMQNGSLPKSIRLIRQSGIRIHEINEKNLLNHLPEIDSDTAKKMTDRFAQTTS